LDLPALRQRLEHHPGQERQVVGARAHPQPRRLEAEVVAVSAQDDFFSAPPLNDREARWLEQKRRTERLRDAHDETGSMSEDEERERADRAR
jgi:hypothetical protein